MSIQYLNGHPSILVVRRSQADSQQGCKQAGWIDVASDRGRAANWKALKILLGIGAAGTAVGAGVTGLSGLSAMKNRQVPATPVETEVPLPYPATVKQGWDWDPANFRRGVAGAVDQVKKFTWPHLAGVAAKSPQDLAWLPPALAATGVGSVIGGSKLSEYLIHKKMKEQQDQELGNAQRDYEKSLISQYKPGKIQELLPKSAQAINDLDRLYDLVEKTAHDTAAMMTGAGLTAAGLIALLAARGGYRYAQGRSNEDLLSKAVKNKAYLSSLREPPPIHVSPVAAQLPQEEEAQAGV